MWVRVPLWALSSLKMSKSRSNKQSAVMLNIKLMPRARKTETVGMRDGRLLIRVTEPPVDGKANAALCRYLAKKLGVAQSSITVIHGKTAREKTVKVDGYSDLNFLLEQLIS